MPAYATPLVREFYSKGIQAEQEDSVETVEHGAWNKALGRNIKAFLFMDDTALVARSQCHAGLAIEAMARRYVAFCRKFQMRVNASKSKSCTSKRALAEVQG